MDDIISLGVGEPDFSAPWAAREAAIASLEQGKTSYTANRGKRELRELIADDVDDRYDLEYDADEEILVTAGASEALDLAFRALLNPGDTVAVVQPAYVSLRPGRHLRRLRRRRRHHARGRRVQTHRRGAPGSRTPPTPTRSSTATPTTRRVRR